MRACTQRASACARVDRFCPCCGAALLARIDGNRLHVACHKSPARVKVYYRSNVGLAQMLETLFRDFCIGK